MGIKYPIRGYLIAVQEHPGTDFDRDNPAHNAWIKEHAMNRKSELYHLLLTGFHYALAES